MRRSPVPCTLSTRNPELKAQTLLYIYLSIYLLLGGSGVLRQ